MNSNPYFDIFFLFLLKVILARGPRAQIFLGPKSIRPSTDPKFIDFYFSKDEFIENQSIRLDFALQGYGTSNSGNSVRILFEN